MNEIFCDVLCNITNSKRNILHLALNWSNKNDVFIVSVEPCYRLNIALISNNRNLFIIFTIEELTDKKTNERLYRRRENQIENYREHERTVEGEKNQNKMNWEKEILRFELAEENDRKIYRNLRHWHTLFFVCLLLYELLLLFFYY